MEKKKYMHPEISIIAVKSFRLMSTSEGPNVNPVTDAKSNNVNWDDEWETTSEDAWRVGYSNDFETNLPKVKSVWDD